VLARLRIGEVPIDVVSLEGALDAVEALVRGRLGGVVFTPNVDHVVKAERHAEFAEAYQAVDLSLADGMPLVWMSRVLGSPLPERVAGSDLVLPLARRAAARGWSVYLLGGDPGHAEAAAEVLSRAGVRIAGCSAPRVELAGEAAARGRAIAEEVRAARPDLVYVALGAPKQEVWIHRHRDLLRPAVVLGVGASISFVAGAIPRAPRWMSRIGAEWLYRLWREPGRLWRRYLVEDPAFLAISFRTWRRLRRESRAAFPELNP
jgi:N-acetylglucosaminyldiphosphoundecaprenol N-acetyl-beta-D-mannosaminyltransferase